MKKVKHILLSFVGSNDKGKLKFSQDGAIISALTNQKFDKVILLWNQSGSRESNYLEISNYLKDEINKRKLAKETELIEFPIKDVTDHNKIYTLLKTFTDTLNKSGENIYTAGISSGTPAMQVCWILLSESGDFSDTNKLNLIKVKDPKFGKSENISVNIDTTLPRIIRLKEEVETLKNDLIPRAIFNINKAELKIGEIVVPLTPIELCYYKYFAERVIEEKGDEKFPMYNTTNLFLEKIIHIHEEIFPESESNRMDLIKIKRKGIGLAISTFRGNVSKLNKKIKQAVQTETIVEVFGISADGVKGAKFYGIKAPKEKLLIKK